MGLKKSYISDVYLMYEDEVNKNKTLSKEKRELKLENELLKTDNKQLKSDIDNKIKIEVDKATKPLLEEILKLKKCLDNANVEIDRLKQQLEKNKNDEYTIDKLINQVNKDSTNSGIPTSQENKTKKKKGANIYNHREKSNKTTGGQVGHQGCTLTKNEVEDMIKTHKLKVKTINHYVHGNKPSTTKYSIGLKLEPSVEKHVIIYDNKYKEQLPKELYSDVTYNDDVKLIVTILGNYCCISSNKIKEILCDLTNGIINISEGTIDNFYDSVSERSESSIDNIIINILNGTYEHTDEITTSENGKPSYYRGYANKENVLYKYHHRKGDAPIKEDNILTRFHGTIISDHDNGIFKYGRNNQDCVIHIGRYCKEGEQNVYETNWQMEFYYFLLRIENGRHALMQYGQNYFDKDDIARIEREYDEILQRAYEQNQEISSKYWKEKQTTLYNRLVKSKKVILFYVYDFTVPYDNNHMERLLRIVKGKTKVSGGFRSEKGGIRFGNIMSVIKTCKLRGMNVFASLKRMIQGEALFA